MAPFLKRHARNNGSWTPSAGASARLRRPTNADGRKTVPGGEKANFFVFYEVDEDEVKHNLSMDDYGEDDRWVLLEPAA